MAACGACGQTILFGGHRIGDLAFCSDTCARKAEAIVVGRTIPDSEVRLCAARIHTGRCPSCQGPGPVDVHTSHQVWSALIMTQWKSEQHVVCRGCGLKAQFKNLTLSAVLGWWGFPWGLVVTPLQISRNISSMLSPPAPGEPSAPLLRAARGMIADQIIANERATSPKPLPKLLTRRS